MLLVTFCVSAWAVKLLITRVTRADLDNLIALSRLYGERADEIGRSKKLLATALMGELQFHRHSPIYTIYIAFGATVYNYFLSVFLHRFTQYTVRVKTKSWRVTKLCTE